MGGCLLQGRNLTGDAWMRFVFHEGVAANRDNGYWQRRLLKGKNAAVEFDALWALPLLAAILLWGQDISTRPDPGWTLSVSRGAGEWSSSGRINAPRPVSGKNIR
ncbi:MAG: hypothetical protein AUH31_02745 [Armatimonadetes bacterium 13_1_40CM_64_14]|nr:MAG: hypothetical protein AUH31_02745 [Armatimonadetes bacterium 13_1_40CM_64_14]